MMSLKTTLSLLLLSYLAISISAHDTYKCDHDSIKQNPGTLHIEEDMSSLQNHKARNLQQGGSSSYPNIRIQTYTTFLEQDAPSSFVSYMENQILPPIVDYFQAALSVKYPVVGNLQLSNNINQICERSTPEILYQGVAADFFIYFDSQAVSGSQIANTKYCYLASGTKRPLIARTMINRNMLPIANGDVLVHEKNMYTMMHEMIHGLGFSGSTYKLFIDSNGNTLQGHLKTVKMNGNTRTFLDVAPLTDRLRTHFGCSSLEGALLENGGGDATAASHFERKVFLYEAMTSGSIADRRISEMTLALLEGSGWYVPNYDYAEPFFFGKGQGCSFVTGTSCSNSFDEFCSGSNRGCSPTGRSGGFCNSDSISDGCKYYNPSFDYDCQNDDGADYARLPELQVFGRSAGSKCFTGTLNSRSSNSLNTFCFKYTCSGSGSDTQLQVQVGNRQVTCTQEGSVTVDGYYGAVNCPDPLTFCNTVGVKYCPRNCMGRGTCVNGTCRCNSGFSGIDCALNN